MNEDSTYRPQFVAIEENPEWMKYHEQGFIKALRPLVDMRLSATAKKETAQGDAAYYVDIPRHPYDFILIDGPDHLRLGCAWGSDLVDLKDSLAKNAFAVFDGREETVRRSMKIMPAAKLTRHKYSLCYEIRPI